MTKYSGFSIIELLVVMVVLGVLATAAMPLMELTLKRNKERELKQSLSDIRHAIDAYKHAYDTEHIPKMTEKSGYPPTLASLVDGVPDSKADNQLMFFLRRIPKDPFAPQDTPAAESWGLRSYQSTAEKPQPGADVYDVYSQSEGTGMNGIPYKQW